MAAAWPAPQLLPAGWRAAIPQRNQRDITRRPRAVVTQGIPKPSRSPIPRAQAPHRASQASAIWAGSVSIAQSNPAPGLARNLRCKSLPPWVLLQSQNEPWRRTARDAVALARSRRRPWLISRKTFVGAPNVVQRSSAQTHRSPSTTRAMAGKTEIMPTSSLEAKPSEEAR